MQIRLITLLSYMLEEPATVPSSFQVTNITDITPCILLGFPSVSFLLFVCFVVIWEINVVHEVSNPNGIHCILCLNDGSCLAGVPILVSRSTI